jgi:hypothetical protein
MERTGKPRHRPQGRRLNGARGKRCDIDLARRVSRWERRINESREFINKMSDGGRDRASLRVEGGISWKGRNQSWQPARSRMLSEFAPSIGKASL